MIEEIEKMVKIMSTEDKIQDANPNVSKSQIIKLLDGTNINFQVS
jgi:hypothetical protein